MKRLDALVDAALKSGAQARDVVELSRLFGEERSKRSSDYMTDPRLRAAYLAFFVPQYAAKVAGLVAQHEREGLLALPSAPRVLDVGAGPLSATLGVWLHKGALGAGSVALDLARKSMDAGAALLAAVDANARKNVALVDAPLSRRPLPQGPFDLVVIAHVLNEVGDPRRAVDVRAQLVRDLLGVLAPNGRVLVVEPGTRVHGRALMAVRDALVDAGVPVLSPCRGAPACPLLRTAGDWCHGDVDWTRPAAYRALEQAARLPKDVLKQSHLLVARVDDDDDDDAARNPAGPPTGARIVSGLMKDREGVERRYVCGRELVVLRGRPRLDDDVARPLRHGLLAREPRPAEIDRNDRSERNERNERAQRGDRAQRNARAPRNDRSRGPRGRR